MSDAGSARVGIAITTLGRTQYLSVLIDSLRDQLRPGDRIVIVAQSGAEEVRALVDSSGVGASVLESRRGASLGRNVAARAIGTEVDILHFPNDSTWYPPGSLDCLRSLPADKIIGGITVLADGSPKLKIPATGTPLNGYNAWSIIEMGLVIRARAFSTLGGFDETIGTGASTPWQAGEGTDLVLRSLAHFGPECCFWYPSTSWLGGVPEGQGLSRGERRWKLRAYNRGTARLVRRARYPLWWTLAFTCGGLAWGFRHREDRISDGWPVFVGRVEGLLGRTWGSSRGAAVSR